jgi:hypothetical protein
MADTIGFGFRVVYAGLADADGYLVGGYEAAVAGETNGSGMVRVYGAKTINPSIPEPETVTQTGDDGKLASEQVASDSPPAGVLELGVRNDGFGSFVDGTKTDTLGGISIGVQGTNSADKPTAVLLLSRRAKDRSGGRKWENKIVPAASISDLGEDYQERAYTAYRYAFTASPTQRLPWGDLLTLEDNGAVSAPIIPANADNPVMMHAFVGDAAQDEFILDFTPVSEEDVHVYVEGVLQVLATDYNVDLPTKKITFTVGNIPADEARIGVLYEYDASEIE